MKATKFIWYLYRPEMGLEQLSVTASIMNSYHFYHTGTNLKNLRTIVEALICNFEVGNFAAHNNCTIKAANPYSRALILRLFPNCVSTR